MSQYSDWQQSVDGPDESDDVSNDGAEEGYEICPTHHCYCDAPRYQTEEYSDTVIHVPVGFECPYCAQEAAIEAADMSGVPF